MNEPLISVIMSVFNAADFLAQAMDSILAQSYSNLEFVIINDGSTDSSGAILTKYAAKDNRIRVYSQPNNGLIASLNRAVALAKGDFIARQDADDISLPSRLEKQLVYLHNHSYVGLVGTNYAVIDKDGALVDETDVFTHPDDIRLAEIYNNQFGHGTIMIRAGLIRQKKYDSDYEHAEDYDLWARLASSTKLANLKEPLYRWRLLPNGITASQTAAMQAQTQRIRSREINYFLKSDESIRLLSFHIFSTRGGILGYLRKKSRLLRNISLMYCRAGYRLKSFKIALVAVICAPLTASGYKILYAAALQPGKSVGIEYEPV